LYDYVSVTGQNLSPQLPEIKGWIQSLQFGPGEFSLQATILHSVEAGQITQADIFYARLPFTSPVDAGDRPTVADMSHYFEWEYAYLFPDNIGGFAGGDPDEAYDAVSDTKNTKGIPAYLPQPQSSSTTATFYLNLSLIYDGVRYSVNDTALYSGLCYYAKFDTVTKTLTVETSTNSAETPKQGNAFWIRLFMIYANRDFLYYKFCDRLNQYIYCDLDIDMSELPSGIIVIWNKSIGELPDDWKICDGATYVGPNSESYTVDDLSDVMVVGAGSAFPISSFGGCIEHTHTNHLVFHTHNVPLDHTHSGATAMATIGGKAVCVEILESGETINTWDENNPLITSISVSIPSLDEDTATDDLTWQNDPAAPDEFGNLTHNTVGHMPPYKARYYIQKLPWVPV
jgi:hypothetical protein